MNRFVIRQNIERYTQLLKRRDLDASRRRMLEQLLAEERAKLEAGEDNERDEPDRGPEHPRDYDEHHG